MQNRYNMDGKIRILRYKGNYDDLFKEIRSKSDNEYVQGCLKYILCTGYNVIEFIIRGGIKFPIKEITFHNGIKLNPNYVDIDHKNFMDPEVQESFKMEHKGEFLIDGYIELKDDYETTIKKAIKEIETTVDFLAFYYDSSLTWDLKYKMDSSESDFSEFDENHMQQLREIMNSILNIEEDKSAAVSKSINYIRLGNNSKSSSNKLINYWSSIECLSDFLYTHENPSNKTDIKEEKNKCIEKLFKKLYIEDPIKFVNNAYSKCILSIKRKIESAISKIYGNDCSIINELFKKDNEDFSLYDIRNMISHGSIWKHNISEKELINKYVFKLKRIALNFIKDNISYYDKGIKIPERRITKSVVLDLTQAITTQKPI